MKRSEIVFWISAVGTGITLFAASIAASGQVSPLGVSLAVAVAAAVSGFVTFINRPSS